MTVEILGAQKMQYLWFRSWVAEPFSKWGGTTARQINYRRFL